MTSKTIAILVHLTLGCVVFPALASASTEGGAAPVPSLPIAATPQPLLSGARLAGSAKLRFWGFDVYQATLWVRPGFQAPDFTRHAFALELDYLRDFTGAAIAGRSIEEMRRIGRFSDAKAEAWQVALRNALPDVKKGDRIAGLHVPGVGVRFLLNGKPFGEVRDAEFASLFFGIWLSPGTSEPAMRQSLLAQVQP
jgi:hypothetical protein